MNKIGLESDQINIIWKQMELMSSFTATSVLNTDMLLLSNRLPPAFFEPVSVRFARFKSLLSIILPSDSLSCSPPPPRLLLTEPELRSSLSLLLCHQRLDSRRSCLLKAQDNETLKSLLWKTSGTVEGDVCARAPGSHLKTIFL